MLYDKYKYYVVINILFKLNITSIIGTYFYLILLSFYCISLVLIKPVLIKSFEMKRPFMVWIGFTSICGSKVAKEGKSCPRLLVLQRVAQNAKRCSKVAEHNLFMPTFKPPC